MPARRAGSKDPAVRDPQPPDRRVPPRQRRGSDVEDLDVQQHRTGEVDAVYGSGQRALLEPSVHELLRERDPLTDVIAVPIPAVPPLSRRGVAARTRTELYATLGRIRRFPP